MNRKTAYIITVISILLWFGETINLPASSIIGKMNEQNPISTTKELCDAFKKEKIQPLRNIMEK